MNHNHLKIVELQQLPNQANHNTVYVLPPINFARDYYDERTNRNIGWISRDEQEIVRNSTVGIAGTGGMGGLVAATLVRLGVGTVKIADCENFDISNINRQFGATRNTVAKSKAIETARMLREIADDTTIIIYPQGITKDTVDHFVTDCYVVCDLVEFWVIYERIMLHQKCRNQNIPILVCDTVGHRTNIFYYTRESMILEEVFDMTLKEAQNVTEKMHAGTLSSLEKKNLMNIILRAFVPEVPEYSTDNNYSTRDIVLKRLLETGQASIIATNPPMASGFLSNHILFELLKKSAIARKKTHVVPMPGYVSFDALESEVKHVTTKWW
jgi:molybdopterin/thiamine biosynthesis adenylyltransferase